MTDVTCLIYTLENVTASLQKVTTFFGTSKVVLEFH